MESHMDWMLSSSLQPSTGDDVHVRQHPAPVFDQILPMMHTGLTPAANWDARTVTCRECGKDMWASSLGRHLANLHEIYQQQVVAEELIDRQEGMVYEVLLGHGTLKCPFPL